jgi:hypothetical protein
VGGLERTFYVWPLIWNEHVTRDAEKTHRVIVAPFFMHEKSVATNAPEAEARVHAHKIWPLYSYRRVGQDSRFRMLELWPFADYASVERNWSPWWSLVARMQHGENRDWEVLWGMYRKSVRQDGGRYWSLFPLWERYREADGRHGWSFLKGLVGREVRDSQGQLRLLYFMRFGPALETAPLSPTNQNSTTPR